MTRLPRSIPRVAFVIALAATSGACIHAFAVLHYHGALDALQRETASLHATLPARKDLSRFRTGDGVEGEEHDASEEIAMLLQNLTADLNQLNVCERSLSTIPPHAVGPIQVTPLTLSFRGSFNATLDLLRRFDRYHRAVRVGRLTVERDPAMAVDALSVSMRLQTYRRPPENKP